MQVTSEVVGRAEGVGVVFAQDPAPAGQGFLVEGAGLLILTQRPQVRGKVAGRFQGVGVVFAQDLATVGQGVHVEGVGLLILTQRMQVAGPKEYQHRVPREWIDCYLVCEDCGRDYPEDRDECPDCGAFEAEAVELGSAGRFWGHRGLRPVLAVREVTPDHGIQAGRILRRWYRAKGLTKRVRRQRVDQHTGRVTTRTTTVRKKLFTANRGFVTVNDGPAMASQLARCLAAPEGALQRRRWSTLRSGDDERVSR